MPTGRFDPFLRHRSRAEELLEGMDRAHRAARGRSGTAVTTGPTTVIVPEGTALDTVRQNQERAPEPAPPTISRAERLLAEPGESVGFGRERPPASRGAVVEGTPATSRPDRADTGIPATAIAGAESTRQRPDPVRPPRPDAGRGVVENVKELGKGLGRGVGQLVESAGATLESTVAARGRTDPHAVETERGPVSLRVPGLAEKTRGAAEAVQELGQETTAFYLPDDDLAAGAEYKGPMYYATRVAEVVPQLGAAVAGGAVAGPAGFIAPIYALEAGAAYNEAKERLARTMPPEEAERQAAHVGAIVGAGNAALESVLGVGVGRAFGAFPTMSRFFRSELLKRAPLRITATGFEEALEEAVQGAWNATVQSIAARDPEAFEDFRRNVGEEAIVGGLVGGIFGAANVGVQRGQTAQESPQEARPEVPPAIETPAPPIGPEEAGQDLLGPEDVAARLAQQKADAESLRPIKEKIELTREGKLAGRIGPTQETDEGVDAVTPPTAPEARPEAPESAPIIPLQREQSESTPLESSGGFKQTQVEREAERSEIERTEGAETTIIDAEGESLPARYAWVALEDVVISHDPFTYTPNPDFPQVSQGRGLEADKAAQATVDQRARNLQPELLLDRTSRPTDGPPTVTPRGVALAARKRLIMLHRAKRLYPERFAEYQSLGRERASEFRLDPAIADEIQASGKTPIVARVTEEDITDLETMDELGRRYDVSPTDEIDTLGEAAQRARLFVRKEGALAHFAGTIGDDQTARQYLEGPDGRRFLERLVEDGVIQQRELGNLLDVDRGTPTAKGKDFVQNLLRAAAIPDPNVLRAAPDGVLQKIEHAVPPIIRAASVGEEWDIRPTLREAVEILIAVKASTGHNSVAGFREQLDLTGRQFSEKALNLAQFVEENTATAVKKAFRAYATDAARSTQGEDLFGDTPTPEGSATVFADPVPGPEPATVSVSGTEFGDESTDRRTLRRRARRFARDELQQREFINKDRRIPIVVSGDGIRKVFHHSARRDVIQAVYGLGPMLEEALWLRRERNRDPEQRRSVPWLHHFRARIAIGDRAPRDVAIVVRETSGGKFFYDFNFMDDEGPAAPPSGPLPHKAAGAGRSETTSPEKILPDDAFNRHFRIDEEVDIEEETGGGSLADPRTTPPSDPLLDPVIAPPEPEAAPAGAEPIGPRLTGRLLPPPGGPRRRRRLTSAPDVIHALTAVIEAAGGKTPIRTGRLGTRQARGVFKVEPEVIRLLEANNIPTAWHEAAHAIEKHIYGNPKGSPWVNPRVGRSIQKELVALGRALYGDRKPAGGYKREGWAEFLRLWGTEAQDVKKSAPATTSWFEEVFLVENPKVKKALLEARKETRAWRNQGALARAKASMVETGTVPDRLKDFYRALRGVLSYDGLVEMAQPLHKLAREAERLRGQELAPSEDPFFLTSALRTTHSARAKYMVERAMIDLAGNKVGPALNDIRPLVKGRGGDFTLYLWAKRAEALWLDKNRPEGRNPGLSLADARQIIAELQSAEFDLAAGMVGDWNDGVLDYAAQASPTFAEVVRRVREIDPGRYVPLQREFDALDEAWRGASRSATKASPVKKLRGSGRRVKNPIQAMVTNAEDTIRAAHQRVVVDAIMKLARIEGLGHLVEEVPRDRVPAAQRSVGELLDEISRRLGVPLDKATTEVLKEQGANELQIADLMGEAVTFFSPVTQPRGQGEPIVAHYTPGGGVRWFYLDPDLFETLYAMDVYRLPRILEWTLGSLGAAFRAGTTTLRASFGLVWNPARDVQTMMVNTRASGLGADLFFGWMKALLNATLLRTTGVNLDAYTDTYLALGGEMAQPLGQDIPHTRRAAKRVFEPKVKRLANPRDWYDWYRDLVQAPESAPRVAELRAVAKDIGWEPGEPMTFDQSLELLLASKQVTTDFTAGGSFGRAVNRIVPFFNAAIQGPRATGRAARRRPAVVLAKLLALTALTVWLWWEKKDEEWYKNLDYREKFLHWHLKTRVGENEEIVRIPRAFEIGLIASALPEAALDAWYHEDPDAVNEWWKTTWKSASPGFLPPIAETAAEQLANRDFYFDRPIVPMGEQRKPDEEQFNEYTSRTAIKLGELFNVSPRRIDHALEGTFGRVAGDLLEIVGLGPPELEREKTPADLPVIGRAFMRGGPGGIESKAVDRVYEALEAAQKRQASDKTEETPEQRTQRLQLTDATKAISALSYVRRFTPEREDRNALTREINAIANDALKFHREGRLERGRFSGARKVAERRKEQTP